MMEDQMKDFTHVDRDGKARMVDVSAKVQTLRSAKATGYIILNEEIVSVIKNNQVKKGDVLAVAKIAGISAAKKNWDLVPLCHQINLTKIDLYFEIIEGENKIKVFSEVGGFDRTGVEMEAITAAAVSLITIYDMCKALSKKMIIGGIELIEKSK